MINDYTIDSSARKNMKSARAWIDRVKNDSSLSKNIKSSAIFFMGRRAASQGKKRMGLLFKKAMKELRQESING